MIDVLIVEDDPKIMDLHQLFLKKMDDFSVSGIATTVGEAKDMIPLLKPDLILLDVFLPDGKGTELFSLIREMSPETDVIMITAAKEAETITEAMRGGAFDYIMKPILFKRMEKTLLTYKKFRDVKNQPEEWNQQAVDEWFGRSVMDGPSHVQGKGTLPKGIDDLTLIAVEKELQKRGNTTAEQMAEAIGSSRTTTRRYLEYLVSIKKATAAVDYGTVGRPQRKYEWL